MKRLVACLWLSGCSVGAECAAACRALEDGCGEALFADEAACVDACTFAHAQTPEASAAVGCFERAACDLDAVIRCARADTAGSLP